VTPRLRQAARIAASLPLLLLVAQLCGVLYHPTIGALEHAVFEWVLVAGWRLDEARLAVPGAAQAALAALAALGTAVALGAVGPLPPAGWPEHGATGPRALLQDLAGAAVIGPLLAITLLGFALHPGFVLFVGLGAAATATASASTPRAARRALLALATGAVPAAVVAASLLATSRDGTLYDHATTAWLRHAGPGGVLIGGAALSAGAILVRRKDRRTQGVVGSVGLVLVLAWMGRAGAAAVGTAGLGVFGAALCVRGLAAGLPLLPDPTQRPGGWPREIALPFALAALALLTNAAVDAPSCVDAGAPGITRVSPDVTPFDLDVDDAGHLVTVLREDRLVRVWKDGELRHELTPDDGDPEEVLALPTGDFLVTAIRDEPPLTRLLVLDPVAGTHTTHDFPEICWVSSQVWLPDRQRLLLGCEESPQLFAFDPVGGTLDEVGRLDRQDDVEDLARGSDGSLWAVSLAEGDRLRRLALDPVRSEVDRPIGGFNYRVLPLADRVLVTRFHDSAVVAFDREGALLGSRRVGFGVRPMEAVGDRVVAASMFRAEAWVLDPTTLQITDRLRLGGRVKALASRHDRAWLGTTCGVFAVDLDVVEASR